MKEYQVSGQLSRGFLGSISYETVLPEETGALMIRVSFGKREMENCTEADREGCRKAWRENTAAPLDDEMLERLMKGQKTEINVAVFHNGAYLGCAHRDELEKEIYIAPEGSSEGFRAWKPSGGILEIVLHAYQVLHDQTPYEVTVTGEER